MENFTLLFIYSVEYFAWTDWYRNPTNRWTEIQQKFKLIQENYRDHYSQHFVFDGLTLLKAANNNHCLLN